MSAGAKRPLAALRDSLGRRMDAIWLAYGRRRARETQALSDELLYSDERLSMGRSTYGSPRVATFPGDTARVRIGAFCSIGPDVILMDGGDHRTDWVSTFPFRVQLGLPGGYTDGHPTSRGDIEIGNDVWIGRGARIRSGVRVGDGAVIGAYSMVTRDVRPYAVVVGSPAREVRRRFSDEQVEALLAIAWWDWSMEEIERSVPELCGPDVDSFIARHRGA